MKKTLFLVCALVLSSTGWAKVTNKFTDEWDTLRRVQSMVRDPKAQAVIQRQGAEPG
jgi:hypothetical protein